MRGRTDHLGPQSGVSLIETVVALFVIALMATAGAVMTNQSLRGARAVETRGDAAAELSTALSTISGDLGAFIPRMSQDPSLSEPAAMFAGYAPRHDGRIMVFVRNGWPNPKGDPRSDLQRVEYIFQNSSLIRRSWAAADPGPTTQSVDEILIDGIEKIEARFGRADTWRTEWVVNGGESGTLPQKVEFKITFSDSDSLTTRYLIGAGT